MSESYSIPPGVKNYLKDLGYSDTSQDMSTWIAKWKDVYRASGDFWQKTETDGQNVYKTKRRTIKPAKRVCREWASLILNEDTKINVENETCNEWLEDYFNRIQFWSRGQDLIEQAFALGTGAWALWLDTAEQRLQVRRYTANQIIILSWDDDGVDEIALCTEVTIKGKKYDQLQLHLKGEGGYHIITVFFNEQGERVTFDGVLDDYETGSDDPWFAVITPAMENTCVELSPYGQSIFADAIDILEAVDIAFDALIMEPQLGKMRVFMADMLFEVNSDESGKKKVIPFGKDDATFFRKLDSQDEMIETFAPQFRTDALVKTYRGALQTMGDACGFGMNYFDVDDSGGLKTATEVASDNSQLMRNIKKHENLIGDAIEQIVRAVLQAARKLNFTWEASNENESERAETAELGTEGTAALRTLPPEGDITVVFDDSIIQDTQAQKQQDLQEVNITMNPWEYRVKWYGEDEETAKANAPSAPTFEPFNSFGEGEFV